MTKDTRQTEDVLRVTEKMDLVETAHTICERCGNYYNTADIEAPEDATFYWVPNCPDCNADMTCNPVTQFGLELLGKRLSYEDENYKSEVNRLQARARLFHGRLVGYSQSELTRRAKWFDRKAKTGVTHGPRFYRDIAFRLRNQARNTEN